MIRKKEQTMQSKFVKLLIFPLHEKIQGSQTLYEIISALKQSPIVYSREVLKLIDEESVQLIKTKAAIKNMGKLCLQLKLPM
jgi:hypothetical protein